MTDDVYDIDTASSPLGEGVRHLDLTDRWNTPLGRPNGGYILAAMLRGLGDEIGSDSPLVAAITYDRAPSVGPGTLTCRVRHAGRRIRSGEATLVQADRTIAQLAASFGERTGDRHLERGTPPDLPDPEACFDPRGHGLPEGGIFDRVDYRLADVPGFFLGAPSGESEYALHMRLRGGRPIDRPALAFLCDAFAPPALELEGVSNSMTIQLTTHLYDVPAPGWLTARFTTRHVTGEFHDEDCELWDSTGRLVAQSRQLALLV